VGRLEQPRRRLERAQTHRARIAELWNGFLDGDEPYEIHVRVENDGRGSIDVFPNEYDPPPLDEISLEFGELLYQLRAALDSLVYELAIIDSGKDPPPDADKLEFPIRTSESAFESVAWKLAPLSEHHRVLVGRIQPYPVPEQTEAMKFMGQVLKVLNDWARRDRHRRMHVVASWAANKEPLFDPPEGCTVQDIVVTPDGPLEKESQIASFRVAGWKPGLDFVANPNLTIDISLDEPLPPLDLSIFEDIEDTLSERVTLLMVVVDTVIEGFEETI
jgi:hypothetical protein